MNGHLTVFYRQNAFSVICLIDMEHGAVRIKLCGVGAILQNALCLGFGLAAGLRLSSDTISVTAVSVSVSAAIATGAAIMQ